MVLLFVQKHQDTVEPRKIESKCSRDDLLNRVIKIPELEKRNNLIEEQMGRSKHYFDYAN